MIELIGGILMAFANSVPGVSGGTIAFLMGFFDDMVESINTFLSKKKTKSVKSSFWFLFRLALGWIIGFVLAVLIVTSVFETHIYAVSSLFIGFIIFSIPLVVMEEKQTLKGRYYNALWIIPGAAVVVGITALSSFTAQTQGFWQILLAIPAAAMAVCAMIMPGISGSSLLMIFGLYQPVMDALRGFLSLDFSGLPLIVAFGIGAVVGAVGFVKAVKFLLGRFRQQTVYVVFGMMLASIYSIAIGPETLDVPKSAMTFSTFNWLFFFIGAAVIGGLELLKFLLEKNAKKKALKADSAETDEKTKE
jgi:putative membrane protein